MMDALLPARSVFFGRGEQAEAPSSPPVEDQPLPSSEGAGLILPDVGSDDEVAPSESKEPTVVRLDEEMASGAGPVAPVAPMELDAPATGPRKRGRPSLSASASRNGTPARVASASAKTPSAASKGRTPRSAAKGKQTQAAPAASSPRKRKAADNDDDKPTAAAPPAKRAARGRPPASASRPVSARKAAADAKKNLAPAKQKSVKVQPATKTKGQRGRPRKEQEEDADADADAWEVESIVDSGIDADSSEHMYLVKWKGYSDKDNTWEPKRNLAGCADLLRKFEASNKKTRGPRQKKTE